MIKILYVINDHGRRDQRSFISVENELFINLKNDNPDEWSYIYSDCFWDMYDMETANKMLNDHIEDKKKKGFLIEEVEFYC